MAIVLELVARRGVRLTHVLETHIHNDYVTGGLELARVTGATYVVAAGDELEFDRLAVGRHRPYRPGRPEHTNGLTHAQFQSVRRLAEELPGSAEVFPTHGFGSFCSATPTSGDASTVAEQRSTNPALPPVSSPAWPAGNRCGRTQCRTSPACCRPQGADGPGDRCPTQR
jgi:hydroxyacylglutathione hydrolase